MRFLYELLNGDVLANHHLVERFIGDTLDERWQTTDVVGDGSSIMRDNVGGGVHVLTGTSTNDKETLNFNNINQFNQNGLELHVSFGATVADNRKVAAGFTSNTNSIGAHHIEANNDTSNTFQVLRSSDDTTSTDVATTVTSSDSNIRLFLLKLFSAHATLHVAGDFEAVKTDVLPNARMQPMLEIVTRTSASRTGRFRYFEAFNTL